MPVRRIWRATDAADGNMCHCSLNPAERLQGSTSLLACVYAGSLAEGMLITASVLQLYCVSYVVI